MIYCLTIVLRQQVLADGVGLLDTIHEFAWGTTADEACTATIESLRGYGLDVKEIQQRALAGDQDLRRYPIPELIHGLPWDILEEFSMTEERKLN